MFNSDFELASNMVANVSKSESALIATLFGSNLLNQPDIFELNDTGHHNSDNINNSKFCVVMNALSENPFWQQSLARIANLSAVIDNCKSQVKVIVDLQICLFSIVWIHCQIEDNTKTLPVLSEAQFRKQFQKYALHNCPQYCSYIAEQLKLAFNLVTIYLFHYITICIKPF